MPEQDINCLTETLPEPIMQLLQPSVMQEYEKLAMFTYKMHQHALGRTETFTTAKS